LKILAIDTSVGVSIAVLENRHILAEFSDIQHGTQGEQTAAKISELIESAGCSVNDITNVVVGVGPGPFTGLRVGIATAQAFGFARNLPVVGICSLDAVAFDFGQPCVVLTDARRKELYWAKYDQTRVGDPQVDKPDAIKAKVHPEHFVGPGAQLYPDFINGQVIPLRAAALGLIFAHGIAQEVPVLPMYLRKPDAQEPTTRKSVL
jgi:tRNA threonylcarbamoyl adenosine modification protein YeaZ